MTHRYSPINPFEPDDNHIRSSQSVDSGPYYIPPPSIHPLSPPSSPIPSNINNTTGFNYHHSNNTSPTTPNSHRPPPLQWSKPSNPGYRSNCPNQAEHRTDASIIATPTSPISPPIPGKRQNVDYQICSSDPFGNSSSPPPPRPFLQQINLNSLSGYRDDSNTSLTSLPPIVTPVTPKWDMLNDTNNNRIKHLGWPEHHSGGNAISLSPIRRADVNKGVNYKYTPLLNNSSESDDSSESETEQSYANIRRTSLSPILSSREKNNNDSSSEDSSNEDSGSEESISEDCSDDDTIFSFTTTIKPTKKRKSCLSRLRFKRYDPSMWRIKGMGRKAQFNNERLYLHWIKFGLLQGSIALTLLNFAEGVATWIAVGTFLLALMTLIYGTTLYHKRHLYLVAKRQDVEFFARTMPTLLALGLILIYGANFILVMAYGDASTSATPWTPKSDGNSKNHF